MYHRQRRRLTFLLIYSFLPIALAKNIVTTENTPSDPKDNFENNIIDFDEDVALKYNKKYGAVPWESNERFNKDTHRYTLINDKKFNINVNETDGKTVDKVEETTSNDDYSVIPLELLSTTEDVLISIVDSTTEPDLTVIPLQTTKKTLPEVVVTQSVTLPISTTTTSSVETTEFVLNDKVIEESDSSETTTIKRETQNKTETTTFDIDINSTTTLSTVQTDITPNETTTHKSEAIEEKTERKSKNLEILKTNSTKTIETLDSSEEDVPSFSELDATDEIEVPEDYYDGKDVLPTTAPKTDALSVIFGFAGSVVESVVESVAEKVVPKSIFDLFKRMQKQNEALEAERLRSREENGGIGQFGRGILKSISSGLSKPLSQLMAGAKDIGSLDTDRGFVSSVASSVSSVATSVADAFKDRVQAIYPGTVWCGDGHSATARSSDLGLFFFTDTCCRQHDACKIYIKAGETKYGLTNTGLFTRSHCSCDAKFRECLRKTNSLVSVQIGLTYFNVLGPQCFRKAHPIVKCVRKTRITGQKCEEYELDYTKPKMWQWFDNETF